MIAYPAKFTPEKDAINVTFPDLPGAITCGFSEQEAMEYAVDALETVLSEYIRRRHDIPSRRKVKGRGLRWVVLPALSEAKVLLYEAMRSQDVRKAELARRIGWHKSQMDRLLDLTHASRLGRSRRFFARSESGWVWRCRTQHDTRNGKVRRPLTLVRS